MKIFTSEQIKELDQYTIEHEPIASIDLMERASRAMTQAICQQWSAQTPFVVFAGPGNNGGDALAVARMLADKGYQVEVFLFNVNNHLSNDCATNKQRVEENTRVKSFTEVIVDFDPPKLENGMVVIDGLFGVGLNKPLVGGFASLVKYINHSDAYVISLDMPSGLMSEDNTLNVSANIIRADRTLTLQQKKLAMMMADMQVYIGQLEVIDIGLHQEAIRTTEAQYQVVEEADIRQRLLTRSDFAHKGTMGHALLIAGSYGMSGAAILAAKACLRAGSGKVTAVTPPKNYTAMQVAVPEVVLEMTNSLTHYDTTVDTESFDALGIGPGLGTAEETAIAMISQIRRSQCPIVADADALNILSTHRAWMQQLPKNMIITPHPAEFDRLQGIPSNGDYERLSKACDMATHQQAYVLLKGHYSALCTPEGKVYFNSTGNSGMATAGSGDVLTGILTGLLSRGYTCEDAALVGMYLHGLAGDLAVQELGKESLIASDIIRFLPAAYMSLNKQ